MEQTEISSDFSSSFLSDTEENQKLLKELKNPVKTFSKALAHMEKNVWNVSLLLDDLLSKNIINSEEKLKVIKIGNRKGQIRELTNISIKNGPHAFTQYLKILFQIQNEVTEQVVNDETSSSSSSDTDEQEYVTVTPDTEDVVDGSILSALKNAAVPQKQNQSQQYRRRFKLPLSAGETLIDESLLEEILQHIQIQQHQELHYNPSQEFVAHRFRSQNKDGSESHKNSFKPKAVNPNKYHDPPVQRFVVNRPIFIHRIGFFGPHFTEANHEVTSYEIKVKLIVWVDSPIIIAINREIVEVAKGHKMYVEFQTPVPIRPNLSHWIEFTIKGREKLFVPHRKNRIIDAVSGTKAIFKPPYKNIDENIISYQENKVDSGENPPLKKTESTLATSSSLKNETPENSNLSTNPKLLNSLELKELNNSVEALGDLKVKKTENDDNAPNDYQDLLKDSKTWIDFDSQSYWTCQISEIWFYQGSSRIPADAFPCPHKKIKNRFKKPA